MLNQRSIYQIVKDFLFKLLNKELFIFLFFLALSFVFWLITTLNQTYEKELPVELRIGGVPQNVVITTDVSDTVYVTVKDKGFMLLPYYTSNQLRPITVSFAAYTSKQAGKGQVPLADLRKLIRQQLLASAQITNLKADNLDFYYNYGRKKEVKVVLSGKVVPADNYFLSHMKISPDRVTVYASDAVLDSLNSVQTSYLNLTNFSDTVVRTLQLKAIKGAKITPQTVKVTFYPDVLTEESAEVPVTAVNKPEGVVVRTFPQRVKVNFICGASMYRTLNLNDFKVVVDYNEIAANPSSSCSLQLIAKPSGVRNAQLEMDEIDYLIEQ